MPTKFKPSTYKRVGGVKVGSHTYMSGVSVKALQDVLESNSAKPKMKNKVRKELVRRGVV